MEIFDLKGKELTKQNIADLMRVLRRDGEARIVNGYRMSTTPGDFLGSLHLTRKEKEIVVCIVAGNSNKEIANLLWTTEQVIKNYTRGIYDKMGMSNRTELVSFVYAHTLLPELPALDMIQARYDSLQAKHSGERDASIKAEANSTTPSITQEASC